MFGFYENFPENLHYTQSFTYLPSRKSLQQRSIKVFHEINCATFTFEEVGSPTVPKSSVIFELGIADTDNFTFLNDAETTKALDTIANGALQVIDFFCAIRYYKKQAEKKTPLKFDYFMLRAEFGKEKTMEIQVFHERGPRYISPAEVVAFLVHKINGKGARKSLKPIETT